MLNFLIYIHRKKLEKMILRNVEYDKILKQSQKLDELINQKMKKINKK